MNRFTMQQDESKPRFKVGSRAFFEGMPGFNPRDIDEVEFEENPKFYKNVMQFRARNKGRCLFKWRKMSADEFVEYTLRSKLPMEIGKFLVPEVAQYLGFTFNHLQRLAPVVDRLDGKHLYEKIIYDCYIMNGAWKLDEESKWRAYEVYLKYR